MKINEIRTHVTDLAKFLDNAGGAKSAAKDLEQFSQSLEPFSEHTVATFASFLAKAAEFERTGEVTTKKKAITKSQSNPADVAADVQAILEYSELALSDAVTFTDIAKFVSKFNGKDFPVEKLRTIASELHIPSNSKTKKKDLVDLIQQRIAGGKRTQIHVSTVDM